MLLADQLCSAYHTSLCKYIVRVVFYLSLAETIKVLGVST